MQQQNCSQKGLALTVANLVIIHGVGLQERHRDTV